ncbi:MAG: sensor histidine kinase [Clostridia bacterium]|nr:sensor histidine kinase [Clostridia bacterium]
MYSVTFERVVMVILTKVLLVVACGILLKYRFPYAVKKKNAVVLICMTIATELSMVGIMQIFFQFSELTLDLLLASVSIMVINIITYYLFVRINHDIKVETEYSALQQRYENDKQHARDIEELYYKICGMRHDMMQHFTAISGMLDKNGESAKEYIESVLKNQFDRIRYFVKTDNESFDAIANAKIAVCEAHNIKVQTRIMNNSLDKLLPDEIGVLFGNLFDNAIEAAICSKDRIIELDIQRQGEYLSVLMKNSIDKSVLKNNNTLETTKENKEYHGFGTKNIKRIVNKYEGIINYFEEGGCFVCDILI